MIRIVGTTITEKILNIVVLKNYPIEVGCAIAATIEQESVGGEVLPLRGERYKRYARFCEISETFINSPDSKLAFIFHDLVRDRNYQANRLLTARTLEEAIIEFNEGYLNKKLSEDDIIGLTRKASYIYKENIE